jgi:hypothetical protein
VARTNAANAAWPSWPCYLSLTSLHLPVVAVPGTQHKCYAYTSDDEFQIVRLGASRRAICEAKPGGTWAAAADPSEVAGCSASDCDCCVPGEDLLLYHFTPLGK